MIKFSVKFSKIRQRSAEFMMIPQIILGPLFFWGGGCSFVLVGLRNIWTELPQICFEFSICQCCSIWKAESPKATWGQISHFHPSKSYGRDGRNVWIILWPIISSALSMHVLDYRSVALFQCNKAPSDSFRLIGAI